jgi:DNA-binding transcriptional MerR regulator
MGKYSIKDLENISGIKAHTIRIWEKRYKLIEPKRTDTNIRYYSECDLRHLLNISILNHNGLKISQIASMNEDEIKRRVFDVTMESKSDNVQLENLMSGVLELEEVKILNIISASIIKEGFESTVENLLLPFIDRVYSLWQTGTVISAQKQFVLNLIRRKLVVAIDNEARGLTGSGPRMIMFLPEHETDEIELFFNNYMARKENFEVIYLGASVKPNDMRIINNIKRADVFMTIFSSPYSSGLLEKQMADYRIQFPSTPFLVGGSQVKSAQLHFPGGFSAIRSIKDFRDAVRVLKCFD